MIWDPLGLLVFNWGGVKSGSGLFRFVQKELGQFRNVLEHLIMSGSLRRIVMGGWICFWGLIGDHLGLLVFHRDGVSGGSGLSGFG